MVYGKTALTSVLVEIGEEGMKEKKSRDWSEVVSATRISTRTEVSAVFP
jgi:hypothetical protein